MKNVIEQFESNQIEKLTADKAIPDFRAGDTVKVSVRVIDGTTVRLQQYEGVVIGKRNRGITSSFVVRKFMLTYFFISLFSSNMGIILQLV